MAFPSIRRDAARFLSANKCLELAGSRRWLVSSAIGRCCGLCSHELRLIMGYLKTISHAITVRLTLVFMSITPSLFGVCLIPCFLWRGRWTRNPYVQTWSSSSKWDHYWMMTSIVTWLFLWGHPEQRCEKIICNSCVALYSTQSKYPSTPYAHGHSARRGNNQISRRFPNSRIALLGYIAGGGIILL